MVTFGMSATDPNSLPHACTSSALLIELQLNSQTFKVTLFSALFCWCCLEECYYSPSLLSLPTLSCLQVFQLNSALTSRQVYHTAFVLNRPGLYSSAETFLKLYSLERKTKDYKKCLHHSHPKWIFLNYPITCPNSPWRFGKGSHSDGVALSRKTCP